MKNKFIRSSLLKIYDLLYERFGPMHWWPGDSPLEIIIGAILTQNTNWANVEKAVQNLKAKGCLNIKKLTEISEKSLARLIKPSGYYNIKAHRLKNFMQFLNTCYNGSLDRMFKTKTHKLRQELLSVNGIGPETADSILLYAGNKKVFVVDGYTKRIFVRHGFLKTDADYAQGQALFTKNLEPDIRLFNEFHALLVELGKNICRPKQPLCNVCPIRRLKHARSKKAGRD